MNNLLLEARGIVKEFPGVRALDGVDLVIKKGEVHALVGENGAGKSTLMLTLGGIHQPDEGFLRMNGRRVVFESPFDANEAGIGIVYQELSLVPALSIAENIFANRQPLNRFGLVDKNRMAADTTELLALFDLECLDPLMPVKALSIANQQVVEILKAISVDPKILIMDEPTSSLTEVEIERLFENIRKLKEDRGLSFIYISHHLPEIFAIADTVTVLRDGRYVCDAQVSEIDEDFLVTNMVGRTIGNMYGYRAAEDKVGETVFEVRNLTKRGLFQDISFSVGRGEIVGFAGLVGAGRTEVGRAIFGAEPADSGSIRLKGKPYRADAPNNAINQGIGYLTEDRKNEGLFLDSSIRENVVANHLYDFSSGQIDFMRDDRIRSFASHCMDQYRISAPGIDTRVVSLSGGNQQKVLIGAWLGIEPDVLIVDEPTRGVDVGAKSDIYQLLRELARRGTAIVMISSDLPEVLGMSDRIYVMQSGRIVGEVPGVDATEERIIALATGSSEGVCEE